MRGTHLAAIAFILMAQCPPIPSPADADGPVIAWQMRGTDWVPVMSFSDDEACVRAAQALTEKSGTYFGCGVGTSPPTPPTTQRQRPALRERPGDVTEKHR